MPLKEGKRNMENRTLRILEAIVDEYIRTGEAVGSKLIAEKLDNAVSSATIRNEMAALEQQGYLEHTRDDFRHIRD